MPNYSVADGEKSPRRMPKYAIIVPAVLVALFILAYINPFWIISSGYVGVIANWGSVQQVSLNPGLHVAIPFEQEIIPVSTQPQTAQSDETASTHDLQNVTTSLAVTFEVLPADTPYFYQNFRSFDVVNTRIISPIISNDVKAVTARFNAEELVTQRDTVDSLIKEQIATSLAPYHLTVLGVNVANFAFSDAYEQAIENKQVSQQQALQAQYTLDQAKISSQTQVVQAQAAAQAQIETAKGNATARILNAQAEAKANGLVNASLTPAILQMKAITQWNGAEPVYLGANAPMPFIGSGATASAMSYGQTAH